MTDEDRLLARWQQTRDPLLADTLQRLASEKWLETTKDFSELIIRLATSRLAKLLTLDDPRLTVFFIDQLRAARWPSSGAQKLWTKIFDKLIALRDRRALEPLRAIAKAPPHFLGIAHTKWMVAQLEATANQLEKACAELRDDEEATALIASIKSPLRKGEIFTSPKSKQVSGSSLQLVEAVWAKPDDDSVRLVAADGLMEQNDPWGEFISLQFRIAQGKATDAEKKRADGLLHKYGVRFGGPIAAISTKDGWAFEKGFLVKASADRSMVPRRRWDEALAAPHWATVKELLLDTNTPQWFMKAILGKPPGALRLVGVQDQRLERKDAGSPWRLVRPQHKPTFTELQLLKSITKALSPANRASLEFEISAFS